VLVDAAEEFGCDCSIIDFDTSLLAEALGAVLDFPEDDMARVARPPLDSLADIRKLPIPAHRKDGRLPITRDRRIRISLLGAPESHPTEPANFALARIEGRNESRQMSFSGHFPNSAQIPAQCQYEYQAFCVNYW